MGYADGFYYGQGKIVVNTLTDETVKVIGKTNTYTKASDSNRAIFKVPGGEAYTVEIYENNVLQDTYTADLGYGDVIVITQETHEVELSLTVYSAANDTVYYYDNNDETTSPITLCVTDSSGTATDVSLAVLPNVTTTIIFYSTVAKDTSSGTNAYRKTVALTESTAELKMMPDASLYWYGNLCKWNTNGITFSSAWYNASAGSATFNTNYATLYGGNSTPTIVYPYNSNFKTTGYSSVKIRYINVKGNNTPAITFLTSKTDAPSSFSMLTSQTLTTATISASTGKYIGVENYGGTSVDFRMYALWCE